MTAQRQPLEPPIIPAQRGGVTVLCTHAFLALFAGLALRLLFAFRFPTLSDDSETYLQLARNWADYHVYGVWLNGYLVPTDLRVPGYPAFLAGLAMLFRRSMRAIVLSQAVLDMASCFLAATLAAALAPAASRRRVAIACLWLAATCPFLADYSAAVLTECLATFLTMAALVCFTEGLNREVNESNFFTLLRQRRLTPFVLALLGTFVTGLATMVRPEMPLLFAVAMIVYLVRWWRPLGFRKLILTGTALAGAFLLPIVPWAARNLVTLHEVQFLAPRYVTMPDEYAPVGYYAWTGTWLDRFRDVYLNTWKVGQERLNIEDVPKDAFDSPQEKARVADLFEQYNNSKTLDISPEVDNEFAEIARERTRRHPFRTYLEVPFRRALTIWFTPRTELLPIDGKIWPLADQWSNSHSDVLVTAGFAALGYWYATIALGGVYMVWRKRRAGAAPHSENAPNFWGIAIILAYLVERTAFLTTIEAPEPRYVITCYPAVLALGALLWVRREKATSRRIA